MILQNRSASRSDTEKAYCPSAEEIRAACQAIQATWSETERARRRTHNPWDEHQRASWRRALQRRDLSATLKRSALVGIGLQGNEDGIDHAQQA